MCLRAADEESLQGISLRLDLASRAPVWEHRRKFSVQTDNGL